jgi:hypothetical protein
MPSHNDAKSCCPVCLRTEIEVRLIDSAVPDEPGFGMKDRTNCDEAFRFTCKSCGEFVVTNCDCTNLKSPRVRNKWNERHLSALLREQTISKLPPYWLRTGIMEPYGPLRTTERLAHINLEELLERWPRSIPDRIDRALCNLARMSPVGGYQIPMVDSETLSLMFAETVDEAVFIRNALIDQKLIVDAIEIRTSGNLGTAKIHLTPLGWARFHSLTTGKSRPENPVFVAMWFGGVDHKLEMDAVYQIGIEPAIVDAGYRATRVDLVEHNDFIMDKIFGDIRLSPFVVADFTGHRNGVYLEAGFARGLGHPVIHTCRKDEMDKAHFDTAQLNHVVWETPEELTKKLYHRIVGTIGIGPHPTSRRP